MKKLLFLIPFFFCGDLFATHRDILDASNLVSGQLDSNRLDHSSVAFKDELNISIGTVAAELATLNLFYGTAPIKIDGWQLFKSTGQGKIDGWQLFKTTGQASIDRYDLFVDSAENKIESWILSKSTTTQKIDSWTLAKSTTEQKIDSWTQSQSTVEVKLDDFKAYRSTAQSRTDNLDTSIATHSTVLTTIAVDTSTLKTRTDTLNTGISTLTTRGDNVATDTSTLKLRADGFDLFNATVGIMVRYSSDTSNTVSLFLATAPTLIDNLASNFSTGCVFGGSVTGTYLCGDGRFLTNVTATAVSTATTVQIVQGGSALGQASAINASDNLSFTLTGNTATLKASAGVSTGTYFVITSTSFAISPFGAVWSSGTNAAATTAKRTIAISYTGQYWGIGVNNGNLLRSADYGLTFTTTAVANHTPNYGISLVISTSGEHWLYTGTSDGAVLQSSDYGVTFTTISNSADFRGVGMSGDGKYRLISVNVFGLLISSNYGISYTTIAWNKNWYGVAVSSGGQYMAAVNGTGGQQAILVSNNFGVTWATACATSQNLYNICMSSTGKYMSAIGDGLWLLDSNDYGVTFTTNNPPIVSSAYGGISMDFSGANRCFADASRWKWSTDYGVSYSSGTYLFTGGFGAAVSGNGAFAGVVAPAMPVYRSVGYGEYIDGGYMGLGTNSPTSKLDIRTGSVTIQGANAGLSIRNVYGDPYFTVGIHGNVGVNIANPTYKFQVNSPNPAANGTTVWVNYSDRRLKKNEVDYSEAILPKLMKLKVKKFKYNDDYYKKTGYENLHDNRDQLGFVAQDVKDVFSEMVGIKQLPQDKIFPSTETAKSYEVFIASTGKTETIKIPAYDNPENKFIYDLNVSNFTPYSIKAIQELFQWMCEKFPTDDRCK